MNQTNAPTKVLVIGGGYAGTLAANRLMKRRGSDVTLVNPRPSFVERIRLHQLSADSGTATVDYAELLNPAVKLTVDTVTAIEAPERRVHLVSGTTLAYDYLIYAVGSTGATPALPGARFAYPIAELEQAQRLRARLDSLPADAPVCVVGGGLTGIEAAAEIAERRPAGTVTLVAGTMLAPSLGDRGRASVARQLDGLGVRVLDGVTAAEVRPEGVVLSDGREVPSAATVWTAGFAVPDLAARSGLHTDGMGRLITDETLTSIDDERIVAAGDAAAPSGHPLRMSCQAAGPLGLQAAETVLSRLADRAPVAINQAFVAQCISIGRKHGTLQFTHADDSPRRLYVGGRTAAAIKEQICKFTVTGIVREGRKPGSGFWFRGGYRPAAAEVPVA